MIGSVVGSYRIVGKLSKGGMGAVYRAEHTLIGRPAAVKVLHAEFCSNKDIVNRFFNEAKATTAIKHPGIVEIFDFGYMDSGLAYLVMEFLEGMTLSKRIKIRGVISEGEAAMVLRGVCSSLAAAHAKGIVHRDLKPDNIFVIPDPDSPLGERCKLLDFGIAKLTDIGLAGTATRTGAVMGTPTYMSPEQCSGNGAVDHRADLYSMGCILYLMVTGRPPFVSLGAGELIGAHLYKPPEPLSQHAPSVSPEFEALVMSLLEKQPDRRVQSARDLGAYLTQIAQRDGWVPSPTDPGRISKPHNIEDGRAPTHLTPAPHMYTPVFGTGEQTPAPPALVAAPAIESQPTTLSAATGQSLAQPAEPVQPVPHRGRSGVGIALAFGAVALIAGVGFVAFRASDSSSTAPARSPSDEASWSSCPTSSRTPRSGGTRSPSSR